MKSRTATLLTLGLLIAGCSSKSGPTAPPAAQVTQLTVKSTPPSVIIVLDGTAGTIGTPGTLRVPAGHHTVGLNALGYRDTTLSVTVSGAPFETLSVVLGPRPATPRTYSVWQTLANYPIGIATTSSGPVFVTIGSAPSALLSFAPAGNLLGETSLGIEYATNLAATPGGDVYFARVGSQGVNATLDRYDSNANYVRTILYSGFGTWPSPACPAIGTGDSLFVLEGWDHGSSTGEVWRFVNDGTAGMWRAGRNFKRLAIDPTARRCYFLNAADTVFVFSTGGQPLSSWPTGLSPLSNCYITVAPDGTVYVADQGAIRHFAGSGASLGMWMAGSVGGVSGIAVDGAGQVYVGGYGTMNVVRYVP